MTPQRLAALCALIASDASQRATVVPWTPGRRWASPSDANAAAGYAEDAASVAALREIAAWLDARRVAA